MKDDPNKNTDPNANTDAKENGSSPPDSGKGQTSGVSLEQVQALFQENNKALLESVQGLLNPEQGGEEKPPEDPEKLEMQNALNAMHQANMSGLSDEHKQLVEKLGGDSVVSQVNVLASLKEAGVIGKPTPSSAADEGGDAGGDGKGAPGDENGNASQANKPPRSKIDLTGKGDKEPESLEEADRRFAQTVAAAKR